MDKEIIRNILLDCREIEDVLCFQEKEYEGKVYDILVKCQLVVDMACVPICIGINDDWMINLFDFYIRYEKDTSTRVERFIPHVNQQGKMCLYRIDSILIDDHFEGLLKECVQKAAQIISEGMSEANKKELLREYSAYWLQLPRIISSRLAIPSGTMNAVLKWTATNDIKGTSRLIAALSSFEIAEWYIENSQLQLRNAAFFTIDATDEAIFPPDPVESGLLPFFNSLLNRIKYKERKRILAKLRAPYIMFFHIRQPYGYIADIGFRLTGDNSTILDVIKPHDRNQFKIEPIFVNRIDRSYLMKRIDQNVRPLESLRYLLIGAGSIGGYFVDFLAKAGGKNITIVDNDILQEINIFRHLLGKKYVNISKAKAICAYMKSSLLGMAIRPVNMTIEEAFRKQKIVWDKFDVVISATGNDNVNRWTEKSISISKSKCKAIYLWNEPLDIGCHAVCVDMQLLGRYEDLFQYDENHMLHNASAYAAPNQKIEQEYAGCDGSFIPYGSEVSVQVALLGIDLLKKSVSGRLKENVISSYKGDGIYFREAGFKISKTYNSQVERIEVTKLEDYRK